MPADIVIYHNECFDGYTSALILYLAGQIHSSHTVIHPDVPSASSAPNDIHGDVIVVDVAYQPHVLEEIAKRARSVLFIDHHRTNLDEIRKLEKRYSNLHVIYDESECGSSLTWRHYFPEMPMPLMIRMVRDNDIGIWAIKQTKQFLTALEVEYQMLPTVTALKKLKPLLKMEFMKDVIARGKLYYRYRELMVERAAKYSTIMDWGKYRVAFVNIAGNIASEVATRLARRSGIDFAAAYHYNISKRIFVYSLRSDSTRRDAIDVEQICRAHGGGGHKYACAFTNVAGPDAMDPPQNGGCISCGDRAGAPLLRNRAQIFETPHHPEELVKHTIVHEGETGSA
jgi:oligoribonuclease NrnB/cAMP/cGMP phosphodiesterase (DHH superfamily)